MHFVVRFEPQPGKEAEFREAMLQNLAPTRAEAGCLRIHVFESIRQPPVFAVYSEWVDEAAFETHASLPHTVRFVETIRTLIDHPFEATRTRPIA